MLFIACQQKGCGYIAVFAALSIPHGQKVYEVISIEKGWYRIVTEIEEDFFPPKAFEIIDPEFHGPITK